MGVTFHYLDKSMNLTSRYLCLQYLDQGHSAYYLYECLDKILVNWNLKEKVIKYTKKN